MVPILTRDRREMRSEYWIRIPFSKPTYVRMIKGRDGGHTRDRWVIL